MDFITLLILLVIIGVAVYLLETYVPMSPPIKTVIRVLVVLFVVLLLLDVFGIYHFPLMKHRE
jgi:hypothetical protein